MAEANDKLMLVTGGAGFIGSHLVEMLVKTACQVRVLDNFSTGNMENLASLGNGSIQPGKDFEVMAGDIRDTNVVDRAMRNVQGVFHLAALGSVPRSVQDPVTTQTVNADGTLNVFVAARKHEVSRLVYASSSAVYGDSQTLPKREGTEGCPLSPYALTKKVNEEYGRLFQQLYGFENIGLRYFNVYGPRQDPEGPYAAVIPRFISALLLQRPPTIYGTGRQSRDFTHVTDIVKANVLAMEARKEACGRAYNVGRGDRTTLLDLLAILQELLGTDVEPVFEKPRPGDVIHSSADTTAARKMIGFQAKNDLRTGLRQSLDWYRTHLST